MNPIKPILNLVKAGELHHGIDMRAYLTISVVDDMNQEDFAKELVEMQNMPGVDSVDAVIGNADMVVLINAPLSIDASANDIRSKDWVKDLHVFKVISIFDHSTDSYRKERLALERGTSYQLRN